MSIPINTVESIEIDKFDKISESWWDPEGPFRPLHQINPIRLEYITDQIHSHFNVTNIKNLEIIDIGCGGGLISEPLSRKGAIVTGIDAGSKNIDVAKYHATQSKLNITYLNTTSEEMASNIQAFDVVLALEIIEHVNNIPLFLQSCAQLVKPGGLLIISTINRTPKSFLTAIIGAEYILRWLPRGTHDWSKFIKPSEIIDWLDTYNMSPIDIKGLDYKILDSNPWKISKKVDTNYMITFRAL
jgi:2-polyprenyl-6-hydroxyphenyl methylase/3-demethylubiquinone-9 3-methyltransferase